MSSSSQTFGPGRLAKSKNILSNVTRASCLFFLLGVLGCGVGLRRSTGAGIAFGGKVHGGQQPVSGSLIQLFAVGASGAGSAATQLLTAPVYTDASGNFNATGLYTCPSPNTEVYLLSTGGNPGLPGNVNNSSLALMAMLGPCGQISDATYVTINEVTTIGSLWPLSSYAHSATAIGSSAGDPAFASALSSIADFVDVTQGFAPGPALPANVTMLSVNKLYTLADVLGACVNSSGGVAGDGSACGRLFTMTAGTAGAPPTDTIAAALEIAQNPSRNLSGLFNLQAATAPFQPALSVAPLDWTLTLMQGAAASPALPAASSLVWSTQPTNITVGGLMTPAPAVTVVDTNTGSAVTSAPVSITLSLQGGAGLAGPLTATTVNGTATFPGLSVTSYGSSLKLLASTGGAQPALSSAFSAVSCVPVTTSELASSAARFIDSVGVNTHISYTDTEYGNSTLLASELQRLKVKHIRDGLASAINPTTQALEAAGIHVALNVGKPPYSSSTMAAAVAANTLNGARYLEGWEGENEQDVNDPAWVSNWNSTFAALKAANTTGTPVWGPPLAFASNAVKLTPVQAAYGTFHPYPGGQNPSVLYPSQMTLIQPLFPGDPVIATESGYHNALADHSDQPAIDYATGAKYFPRLLLESFNAGVYRTYIYELFDEESSWNTALQDTSDSNEQCHWGLVDASGVEKPGFTAIRNLLTILSAGDAETNSPTSLSYTLSGGTNIHHLLVQKSPTVFDLILWQNVSSWNQTTQTEVRNPAQTVTLTVNGATVTTYQPSVSASGTPQTMTGASLALSVPDEALIAEITLNTTASCTAQ